MAERMIKRRASRLVRSPSTESSENTIDTHNMGKSIKKKTKKPKERWLLTRKTWRYMTDAGRKLIPDGAQNKPEDLPKIEAYFQEVCKKEPKFLLWRKNSYPGALNIGRKRRDRFKGGSCRKASSAGEFDIKPERPKDLAIHAISGGRFDLHKMKHDFLNKPHSPTNQRSFPKSRETPSPTVENREEHSNDAIEERKQLANMLEQYLSNTTSSSPRTDFNYQELIDKLQKHLVLERNTLLPSPSSIPSTSSYSERVHFEGDHVQKNLSETLSRYFSQLPNRDKVISDMLTNRKALEKLYFELRKTKGFRSRSNDRYSGQNQPWSPSLLKNYSKADNNSGVPAQPSLPPPVIEIQTPAVEITYRNHGIQTVAIPETELLKIEEEYKKMIAERDDDCGDGVKSSYRRRSSVDNDDVSQSVSDTIKRYLRMARKKSVDSDKADRFKRVNYDRNLRNIKAKGEITKPGDDDGLSKGCQTNENWIVIYRDLKFDEYPVSEAESRLSSARSSIDIGIVEEKASPTSSGQKSSHSFLSNLLHGKHGHDKSASAASATGNMQKSKSSSNVHHAKSKLTKKSLFKSRSKSQTRPSITTSNWTPQGSCVWNSIAGKQVLLGDTSLLQLTQTERKLLQKVALAKLQALNLGVSITLPTDSVAPVASKPKRKTYLLKRKALTTGIFDTNRKDVEKEKDVSTSGGLVFGIPLPQCIENDRLSRIASGASSLRSRDDLPTFDEPSMERHGSRASFSSLVDTDRTEEKGSCDNLLSRDRIVGSVPGLLNTISCNSTIDILAASNEDDPAVPNILNACIRHLELYGLHTLGLFRVSTSKKRIRQLREDFDCGKEIVLESDQCPHDVATLIKEYLRELPDPLLCRDLYHAFVHTQKIRNRRLQLEALQYLVQLLPPANRDTLYTLLKFLANVAKHSNDSKNALGQDVLGNKMDANNLATVFAPNILHCIKPGSKDNSGDRPEDRTDVINVVRTLIEHNKDLFEISSELLDEVYVHMMDSHPEILDNLLSKKEDGIAAEESLDDLDSESLSAPWSPEQNSHLDYAGHRTFHGIDDHDMNNEHRKMYSREEFLHETAATGGPDIAMKIRYKDRYREKSKKKRDESNIRRKKEEDMGIAMKTRSSSIESNSYHETGQMTDRRKSSPYLLDSSGVITASLTIPVQTGNQALPLNVEDGIPYIEDGSYIYNSDGRQQMTTDVSKSPTAPQRRRQRSISGSDSSAASNIHPVTGSISIGQQGYDSAMGSSATFSTPPHNTTPSSVSSSIADPGVLSSPPSWASTPPTSPDSQCTSVNYIPDDISSRIVRTIPVQKPSNVIIKDSPILQKITFTSTSELQQLQKPKQIEVKSQRKENIQKSPSSPAFVMEKQAQERDYSKFSTSITSIGNAVLRSRTADFERISKTDGKPATTTVIQKTVTSEKKKYTKRRYTDSRHQTRHIPDSETLEAASNSSTSTTKTDKNTNQSGPVYKRREIISSVPSR